MICFVSRLWKQEARFNPYMVVHIFTGYFTLSAMWPSSHSNSLSFEVLSPHNAVPFLPATLFCPWCSDPSRVKDHHLDLGIYISTASLYGWPFWFYSGFHNSPDRPQYQGTRQGNIRYAPKTRPTTPIRYLNPLPKAENHPPSRLFGSQPFHTYMDTCSIFLI
jgi:hypothetical protein